MKKNTTEHKKKMTVIGQLVAARESVLEVRHAMMILGLMPNAVERLRNAFDSICLAEEGTWNRAEKSFRVKHKKPAPRHKEAK